jgi:ssDNA-binding Zn-finger/Zn-ribbon topoisomerase 1
MKKKISLHVKCPHCRKSLMDNDKLLHGEPSIKLNIVSPAERGVLHVCSIYECFDHEANINLGKDSVIDAYCPQCNKELLVKEECKICGAPMISFVLTTGGRVNICARNGCSNHYIAFQEIGAELTRFYEEFGE